MTVEDVVEALGGSSDKPWRQCGCPHREAMNAEDCLEPNEITLRLHNTRKPGSQYVLNGNFLGHVEEEGTDEYGPYTLVRLRPSRFHASMMNRRD